ncbi:hypothetical protein FGO68_gene7448 [Halteria grandinella]|uniref:NAD(P)(+)--arginine ADP-ribosyltransferase n=1 Tax=Halteria grandinella TaxID=5974 RepID=A0A8J8T6K9_HALGN|nr:hypothetical protein FGO68_gene7448 [Halteria grandinella]
MLQITIKVPLSKLEEKEVIIEAAVDKKLVKQTNQEQPIEFHHARQQAAIKKGEVQLQGILIGCFQCRLFQKDLIFISSQGVKTAGQLKQKLSEIDPQRLPLRHLIILKDQINLLDQYVLDFDLASTIFDVQYRLGLRQEVINDSQRELLFTLHSLQSNLLFSFEAYSAYIQGDQYTYENKFEVVKKELRDAFEDQKEINLPLIVIDQLKAKIDDPNFFVDTLIELAWIYTQNSCYSTYSHILAEARYNRFQNFFDLLSEVLGKVGKCYEYKRLSIPVYRGISLARVNLDQYKVGSVGYWPSFTSTSKDMKVALGFSKMEREQSKKFLFEIYLTGQNQPASNIEFQSGWSTFEDEHEVLLYPFFSFHVVAHRETQITEADKVCPCKIVTLIEMPCQNLLEIRKMHLSRLIWLDPFDSTENQQSSQLLENRFKALGYARGYTIEEGIKLINQTVRSVVLMSGLMAQAILPRVHEAAHIKSIIIFCGNISSYEKYLEEYPKVRAVVNRFDDAFKWCEREVSQMINSVEPPDGLLILGSQQVPQ